jgi:16S rRNA (adenine(1408)-N(1))-methyltransferase
VARFAPRVSLDVGTGDGRLPYARARESPERFFIGLDANAAGLREWSGRASRERLPNLAFVRAAVEELPAELRGIADRVSVVLPWGSLLAAVAGPSVPVLAGLRAACQPGAALTVVLGSDPGRDERELRRLGLPPLDSGDLAGRLREGYAAAGLAVARVRPLPGAGLSGWPSTWARRLALGRGRAFVEVEARAV